MPNNNYLIHCGFILSLIMWFFLSPQMRYGGYSIVGGSLIFYVSLILSEKIINVKKFNIVVLFLLIISTSYFMTKNVTRVVKIINNSEFSNFPWPEYSLKELGTDYNEIMINQIKLNLVLNDKDTIKGGPVMCGNIDMLCLPAERIVCVSNIQEKNGYFFIRNYNPECLTQFRSNYFQH